MNTNLQDLISKINKLEDELYKLNQSKDINKADLSKLKLRLKEIKKIFNSRIYALQTMRSS